MPVTSENDLRNLLASDLSILEAGLILLEKEAYLPHEIGTRSFVDLLAQDATGRYVLIELKRTAAASREAIHEVYKYVEAARKHLGTREDEVRVLVVSTDWRELLVPFSRFLADTDITVKGLLLKVTDDVQLAAEPITPLPTNQGRYLAPWHHLNLYHNAENLERGIREHESYCNRNDIRDFVMVILKAAPHFTQDARANFENVYKATLGPIGGAIDEETVARLAASLENFEFILYFAMRMMSRTEGIALIMDDELRDQVDQQFEAADQEEALCHLHQSLAAIEPEPYRDYYEIGYPAKLRCKLLQDEHWTVQEVRRYGAFARNAALSDQSIIDELGGSDGVSKQDLKSTINVADSSQLRVLRDQLSLCLADNPR
jgi:Endonuclease NucS C-terminal domain